MPTEKTTRRDPTELKRLRDENAQLRTMLVNMLRTIKQVELCLQIALDREKK